MQPLNYRKIKQLNLKVSNFLTVLVKIILFCIIIIVKKQYEVNFVTKKRTQFLY